VLRVREGGSGNDVLLLLHGLGGTGDIWGAIGPRWNGRWIAPDLPGHGGSDRLASYTFEAMAAALIELTAGAVSVTVLGHSLGGAVGLALAAMSDRVRRLVGLGIKVVWAPEELERARALSQRPISWFDTEAEALQRHRRVAGLGDLVDDSVARHGVVEEGGRWRLALDPAAFAVGAPDLPALLAGSRAEVILARGEHDPMVTHAQLAALVPDPVTLPGLGHNAHLEDAAKVFALL
jgi:pimeloyl-ACP methyl ester carboxylesterase